MAYVYRHIRLDKDEPFYIGVGNDTGGWYKRAKDKRSRNSHWRNVTAKSEYIIEILVDNISWEEARLKEKEFIKLYGRSDKNEGSLVNKTDGGDGSIGFLVSKESREKKSKALLGIKKPQCSHVAWNKGLKLDAEYREKLSKSHKGTPITFTEKRIAEDIRKGKPILMFDLNNNFIKEFHSAGLACKEMNLDISSVSRVANGILKQTKGFRFKYK